MTEMETIFAAIAVMWLLFTYRLMGQIASELEQTRRILSRIHDLLFEDTHGLRSISGNVRDVAKRARQQDHDEFVARHF